MTSVMDSTNFNLDPKVASPFQLNATTLPREELEPLEDPKLHTLAITASECDKKIMKLYTAMTNDYWVPRTIHLELDKDARGWASLSEPIKHFIKLVLAFFAISDGIVNETLSEELANRVTLPEARVFYRFQEMMEDIHNLTYNLLIESYVTDPAERKSMLNAAVDYPAIKKKVDWLRKWMGNGNPMHRLSHDHRRAIQKLCDVYGNGISAAVQLRPGIKIPTDPEVSNVAGMLRVPKTPLAKVILVNTIMEGIFFQSSFCAIFWINHMYSGALPGLIKANEYISRDEGQHTIFGVLMYQRMKHRLSEGEVHTIMREAVDVEAGFARTALPTGLLGMNADLMTQYVQFMADQLLVDLGYARIYNAKNPFDWMNKQSMGVRITDFFVDSAVTEYTQGATEGDGKHDAAKPPAHRDEDF